jgi:uncharacterized protein (TIRG00374 family)
MMTVNAKQLSVTLAITVVFLALAFYRVDLAEVRRAFSHVNYLYLLPTSLVICLGFATRALRWRYMLQSQRRIGIGGAFSAMMIGYLVNNLLPARLGELARTYVLRREEGVSMSFSLATIVVERVLDSLVVVACLIVTLPLFSTSPSVRQSAYLGGGILAIALAVSALSTRWEQPILTLMVRVTGRFSTHVGEMVAGVLTNFSAGLRTLQSRFLVPVFVLSLLAWVTSAVTLYLVLLSMGISISLGGTIFTTALLGISMMVPASPGSLGTYEFFATSGLVLLGVERAQALSLSLLLHIFSYAHVIGLGLISLWSRGLSLQGLRASLAEAETPGTIAPGGNRR